MKVVHGSLKGLVEEVKEEEVETVRVAAFMQSDVVPSGSSRSSRFRPVTSRYRAKSPTRMRTA